MGLVIVGLLINLLTGQSWIAATDLSILLSGSGELKSAPPANLAEFAYGFRSLASLSFVQLAILILILLPAFRVAFLLGNFVKKRDWAFVVFSAIVLFALTAGFFLRIAGA